MAFKHAVTDSTVKRITSNALIIKLTGNVSSKAVQTNSLKASCKNKLDIYALVLARGFIMILSKLWQAYESRIQSFSPNTLKAYALTIVTPLLLKALRKGYARKRGNKITGVKASMQQ
ncbi:hypothetical protein BN871_JQ_00040 [Paenibacillus sp. P22]|nr:hypothetical protein BN871_JQ_00040 [Paenibacillus sp. P22]